MPIAKRGEVWFADLGFAAKIRPILILSVPYLDGDYALYAVVPHTTSLRGSNFEVKLTVHGLREGAFNVQGLFAVPPAKLLRKISQLLPDQIESVEIAVKKWLGLSR
ncbi:MAG: type II toxin-antitoxin system PemK/MazF family toxin [bacterium]|nr:type II toxin-antitoxin system PemK/MazF family toxin [bacterium]